MKKVLLLVFLAFSLSGASARTPSSDAAVCLLEEATAPESTGCTSECGATGVTYKTRAQCNAACPAPGSCVTTCW